MARHLSKLEAAGLAALSKTGIAVGSKVKGRLDIENLTKSGTLCTQLQSKKGGPFKKSWTQIFDTYMDFHKYYSERYKTKAQRIQINHEKSMLKLFMEDHREKISPQQSTKNIWASVLKLDKEGLFSKISSTAQETVVEGYKKDKGKKDEGKKDEGNKG